MPPNVKESVALVDHLATFDVEILIDPKFNQVAPREGSAATIEANSVADSKRLHVRGNPGSVSKDDYWQEALCHERDVDTLTAEEVYTNENKNSKKQIIEKILREEKIRQLMKIEHIEASVAGQRHLTWDLGVTVSEDTDAADSYWEWSTSNVTHDAQSEAYWCWPCPTNEALKKQLIARILEEENIRQQLSTLSIVKNLVKTHCHKPQTEHSSSGDDSYWNW